MNESHRLFVGPLRRSQLIALDLMAALGFALVALTATAHAEIPPWARLAIPLGLGLPLALRRVSPLPVFLFTVVLAVMAVVSGAFSVAYVSPAYALYQVAVAEDRGSWVPTSAIGGLVLLTGAGLVIAGGTPDPAGPAWLVGADEALFGIAALGGAWTVGRAVRERRRYAARQAERLAEQAVADERLRIARELHDVVTHNVGLIAVKAGVANHVLATRPEEAHDALRVIERASRNALVEMRHLLGVLRSSDAPERGPVPGLHVLGDLAQQARQAGVDVELDVQVGESRSLPGWQDGGRDAKASEGRDAADDSKCLEEALSRGTGTLRRASGSAEVPRPDGRGLEKTARQRGGGRERDEAVAGVARQQDGDGEDGEGEQAVPGGCKASVQGRGRMPEGLELSVYRIVQEALTNVVKHAAPARARVSVVDDGRAVRIEVSDDGPGHRASPGAGTGHGLIGMRERVMMYGGTFEAGELAGQGFRVSASLPYGGDV